MLKHDDYFRTHFIIPALEMDIIKMKYPDNPNHPQPKYLLTTKGLEIKRNIKK